MDSIYQDFFETIQRLNNELEEKSKFEFKLMDTILKQQEKIRELENKLLERGNQND